MQKIRNGLLDYHVHVINDRIDIFRPIFRNNEILKAILVAGGVQGFCDLPVFILFLLSV